MRRHSARGVGSTILLLVAAVTMLVASVYVVLGEKGIGVSPWLWNCAVALCRIVTGLLGLLTIVLALTGRGSGSSRKGAFRSVVWAGVLIGAAAAGLGLVIVMTGLGGLVLFCAAGAVAVDALRSLRPEPTPPPQGRQGITPIHHPPALPGAGG